MSEPTATRPHMPDYGIAGESEGTGLLPWSWAVDRLQRAHDYWLATTRADGRPHVFPVWGVWLDATLWFSCGTRSTKAINIAREPRVSMTTDDALNPVVLEGSAENVTDPAQVARFTDVSNSKYAVDYGLDFYLANKLFRVTPHTVFAIDGSDFAGSPTRWRFS